jgi:Mn2+/Fe2+ NRAMP family transporter
MSETRHVPRLGPRAKLLLGAGGVAIIAFPLLRFAAGCHHFLAANLRVISLNADILVPGIAAFVIGTLATHRMLAGFHQRRGRHWPFSNTCCLAALLPVCFTIAFLVPGIILHLELLAGELWPHPAR